MEEALAKAKTLMEALPWIKEHAGQTIVIKYGGNAMVDKHLKESVASDIVLMKYVGANPVIVHGGGPAITEHMKKVGKKPKFVDGLRVTDKETIGIVKKVLVGKINKEIVSNINQHTSPFGDRRRLAAGISGDDAKLVLVTKHEHRDYDLGYVGDVEKINVKALKDLVKNGFIPVVASLGVGKDGQSYNINADQIAGSVAAALKAEKVIFLTNVEGLYKDFADKKSLISELTLDKCKKMIAQSQIGAGMLPKVRGCVTALQAGVKRSHILNGTIPHALLLEIFTDKGVGTMIKRQ